MQQKILDTDYEQLYEQNVERLKGLKAMDENWKEVSKKGSLSSYLRTEGETYYSRAEGTFDIPKEKIVELLTKNSHARIINPDEIDRKQLAQVSDEVEVQYIKTKVPLISDRYSIIAAGTKNLGGDEVLCSCVSVNFDKMDVDKNLVCMKLSQGWFLKDLGNGQTQAIMVSCPDPQGSIPGFMKKKVVSNRGMEQLMIVQEYAKKQ